MVPSTPTARNNWRMEEIWDGPKPLKVRCNSADQDGGVWLDGFGRNVSGARCQALPNFCPQVVPAYTRRTDAFGESHALPMQTEVVAMDRIFRPLASNGQYSVRFREKEEFALGAEAFLECNETLKYHYAFGDSRLVCGCFWEHLGGQLWGNLIDGRLYTSPRHATPPPATEPVSIAPLQARLHSSLPHD